MPSPPLESESFSVLQLSSPALLPPPWLRQLLATRPLRDRQHDTGPAGLRVQVDDHHDLALVSVVVPEARSLDADAFEEAVVHAYRRLLDAVERIDARHPVRLWNFVPSILEPLGSLPHRYMVFNAGRYRAFQERYHDRAVFPATLATASGTGHRENGLALHCLASVKRGAPVENPRQIPAYLYSPRWGPRPPCFARATRWRPSHRAATWLLVGGTASVRGEDSVHPEDLPAQARETVLNLTALLRTALHTEEDRDDHLFGVLRHFRELRVYHPDPDAAAEIELLVRAWFPDLDCLQMVCADLCRPDLLLEIEGVAELPPGSGFRGEE